jgi:hypothetical protein
MHQPSGVCEQWDSTYELERYKKKKNILLLQVMVLCKLSKESKGSSELMAQLGYLQEILWYRVE